MVVGGVYGVVAFSSIGGVLFGLDQANWGGAITKEDFQRNFCLGNGWGTENGTCADDGKAGATENCWDPNYEDPDDGTRGRKRPASECACENACLSQTASEWSIAYSSFISAGSGLMQFGAAFGALFLAPQICVNMGRREGLFIGAIITAIGNFGQALVTNYVAFIGMRIVDGFGVGVITFSLPMFVSEISPVEVRGRLGSMMQLTMVIGTVIASWFNQQPFMSASWSFSMPAYPAIIVASGIFFFPRSPRFAIIKANRLGTPEVGQEEAYKSLMVLRNNDAEAVKEEIADINESLAENVEEKPWSYILANKSLTRRLVIASMLQWLQQFSGINALLGMGPTILASSVPRDELDPLVGATWINVFNLVFTVVMASIIDMLGRRILLLAGAAGMTLFMLIAAYTAGQIDRLQAMDEVPQSDVTTYGWIMFFCLCAYISSFAIGWGGVPWVYPSEIFPMDVKEKCLSISVGFQWFANWAIASLVAIQLNVLGNSGTFLFYGICLVFAVVYVFFQIPETKGVKMEDMDALFGSAEEASKIVYDGGNTNSFSCSVDAKPRRPSQVGSQGAASFSEMTPSGRRESQGGTPKQRTGSRVMKGPGASFTLV